MTLVLDDTPARERIRTELETSFVVEAAAGTGKTTILIARLVNLLASGAAGEDAGDSGIGRIVAVTFTRKAAGELKLRLRLALDTERQAEQDAARRGHLEHAIAHLEEALIGTIHSFCADILRQRPVEARIDPAFREIDEEETADLFNRAFRGWIETRLEAMPEGLRRALSRLAVRRAFDGSTPLDQLRDEAFKLLDWRHYPASWSRRPFDREAAVEECLLRVAELAQIYRDCPAAYDSLRRGIESAEQFDSWLRSTDAVSEARDYDALEARLIETLNALNRNSRWTGRGAWPVDGLSRAEVVRRRDGVIEALRAFRVEADADLAALLREELTQVIDRYEELKRQMGRLDFLDLLIRTRDLLLESEGVRRDLQHRYAHVFVDEFQDTDPLQIEIILLLCADDPGVTAWQRARPAPGKLFLVGDPKQSIYRFRRADVALYMRVVADLQGRGVAFERLTRSWRSGAGIQQTVNAAFAPIMDGDSAAGRPDYVPLGANERVLPAAQQQVIALPVPRPYGKREIAKTAISECLPDATAAWIHWLLHESGWVVEDPEARGEYVEVRPKHIALLFRRFKSWGEDVSRPYLQALEARGIPHLLAGGRSFYQREEVGALLAALTAIEWPGDELSVFATLKGSLFAIRDDALLRFRHEVGRLHPFKPLPEEVATDEHLAPIGVALGVLADLHKRRNRHPVARTVQDLIRTTRAHAGFAMRPAGNQVLANVQHVCDLAMRYELRGGASFRGFVERLRLEADQASSREAPVLDQRADGVRLLTVHDAKGLEFPVVILADITANLSRATASTFLDAGAQLCAQRLLSCAPWELVENEPAEVLHEQAESDRLTYVAATRARDILVVPAVGEGTPAEDHWVSPLYPALFPPHESMRHSAPADGCPAFGERTVLKRPHATPGGAEPSIRPGLHRSVAETEVVWWDPAILDLEAPRDFGLRQKHILAPAPGGGAADEGEASYAAWRARRAAALVRGGTPSLTVRLASYAESGPDDEYAVELQQTERVSARPAGRRFGTLVHTILKDVAWDADTAAVRGLAVLHGRNLGAPLTEIEAALVAVQNALGHTLLRAAAASSEVHREAPFLYPGEDGAIVEGVIDLVFKHEGEWVVVDFKTDEDVSQLIEEYGAQARWYAAAAARLLGGRVRAVLLSV
jgi:ATP-dependent exoDNAse (exonuclease V) beta subunit